MWSTRLADLSFLLRLLRFVQTVREGSEQRKTFLMKELTCAADILIHYIGNVTVNKPAQQVDLPEVEHCDH